MKILGLLILISIFSWQTDGDSLIKTKATITKIQYDDTTTIGSQTYPVESIFEINKQFIRIGNEIHPTIRISAKDTLNSQFEIICDKKTFYYNQETKTLIDVKYMGFAKYYNHYVYQSTEVLDLKPKMIIID
jgi:hypothetical protein